MVHAAPSDCPSSTISVASTASALPAIRTCLADSDCCAGQKCVSNVCANTDKIVATVIKSVSKPLNSIYAVFSLWDDNCNPFSVSSQFINSVLRIEEKKPDATTYRPISKDEGWYGLADNSVPSVARALFVIDVSDSVQKNNGIPAIKLAVTSFLQSLAGSGNKVEVAMFAFGGTTATAKDKILFPISADTSTFSNDYTKLQTVINAATFACGSGIDCSTTDLYGAVIYGHQKFVTDPKRITYDFMIVFSDGSDQAGLHTIDEVTKTAQSSGVTVYGVTVPGEGNDPQIWDQIASGGVYNAKDLNSLSVRFKEIATVISALSQTIYVISYCTPSRQGAPSVRAYLNISQATSTTLEFTIDSSIFTQKGLTCSSSNANLTVDVDNIGKALTELVNSQNGNCFYLRRGGAKKKGAASAAMQPFALTSTLLAVLLAAFSSNMYFSGACTAAFDPCTFCFTAVHSFTLIIVFPVNMIAAVCDCSTAV